MEISKLKAFLTVAREKNLTRAAEALHLSQSALSSQIKALESEVGFEVFERQARGMKLSNRGEALMRYARKAVDAADAFDTAARRLVESLTGTITLGLNTDPKYLRMARLDRRFTTMYPDVRMEFLPSQTLATPSLLREGILDVGYRFDFSEQPGMYEKHLVDVPLYVVVPKRLATDMTGWTWKTVAELPWIWTSCQCPFHTRVMDEMDKFGVEPHPIADALDENIVSELVANGKGASIMRHDMADELVKRGVAVTWGEPLHVPLVLACLEKRHTDPLIQAVYTEAGIVWGVEIS